MKGTRRVPATSGDAAVMCCEQSIDGRIVAIDPGLCERLGRSEADLVGKLFVEIVHESDRGLLESRRQDLQSGAIRISECELRLVRASGETFQARLTSIIDKDSSGRPPQIFTQVIDRSPRTTEEMQLRRNNALLRAVTIAQRAFIDRPDPASVFDLLLRSAIAITQSAFGFIGELRRDDKSNDYLHCYAISDLAWDDLTRALFAEVPYRGIDFHELKTLFGAVLTSGTTVISNDPKNDPRAKGVPAGHHALTAFLGVPLRHQGQIVGMIALANRDGGYHESIRDEIEPLLVTCASIIEGLRSEARRSAAEAALRDSEQRFRGYFELPLVGIAVTSVEGKWLEANDRVCQILGYPREELLTMTVAQITHPDDLVRCFEVVARAARGEIDGFTFEKRWLRKDGSIVHATISGRGVFNASGCADYFVVMIQDTSELRAAREERVAIERRMLETQKLESLGALAGGIAHDFNNLMTSVLGHAGLARLDVADPIVSDSHLSKIEEAANRAADLCRQMLAYAGKGQFLLGPVAVGRVVRGTVDLLRISVRRNARVRLESEPGLPTIIADESQIRQVVMNLVLNASEALPDTGGEIVIGTRVETVAETRPATRHQFGDLVPGRYVAISVVDTGCGMSDDQLSRIYEPFYSTKFTGRGLGLSVVLGVVKAHGGALRVESSPMLGTRFEAYFPLDATIPLVHSDESTDTSILHGHGSVLVIDDDLVVATTVASMLRCCGFESIVMTKANAAIERFELDHEKIDLVLLDLTMPELSGGETCRRLRAIDSRVPIVIMSGFTSDDSLTRLSDMGATAFLQKPFSIGELSRRMRVLFA